MADPNCRICHGHYYLDPPALFPMRNSQGKVYAYAQVEFCPVCPSSG
ncbi:hypothetical protein LI90_616 [Carbonactinospora thermoautotrophica]|uniref:Uncharacterized protein n=1 Tax=Carbonactinospora thermoautotrophica TaxID=1469144 RepID=A0A132MMA0_9ACTN|nr:hypothetical protein [Carbonactinospora thermoautotrophica]KWW98986.1 hypothetical protein LI90_616 [Carbonactinospora thermoautotrophica]